MNLLKSHIVESYPHLIVITESWTHGDMDALLKIQGYEIIGRCDRKDTKDGRGGGILLYSSLPNVSESKVITKFHQVVEVVINNKNEPPLHISVVYRSPNSSDANNDHLLQYLNDLPENVIVIGDFTCREIDWSMLRTDACETSFSQKLLNVTREKFLQQYVEFPTNLTPQKNGTVTSTYIDLIFSDSSNNQLNPQVS